GFAQMVACVANRKQGTCAELVFGTNVRQIRGHRTQIGVYDIRAEAGNAVILHAAARPQIAAWKVSPTKTEHVERVERAVGRSPNIASKGTAREFILHPIEKHAPACIELQFSVAERVEAASDAWS